MKRNPVSVMGLLALSIVLGAAKPPSTMDGAPLYAIGVVTPDIEATVRQYERVTGVIPENMGTASITEPDGTRVTAKMYVVFMSNFYIKLFQPITPNGPYARHLDKFGMSIQNAQFAVSDLPAVRGRMIENGGRWSLGAPGDGWAYVDFKEKLGLTLEPMSTPKPERPLNLAPGTSSPLGAMPVTHIGIAVLDVKKAGKAYSKVFGIPEPKIERVRISKYPPGSDGKDVHRFRIARWQQGAVGMELLEPTTLPDASKAFMTNHGGNAAYYITFDAGDRFEQVRDDLQKKGGKRIYGSPDGGSSYLDFLDTLGLVVKITGSPRKR
ncbi:MAG TPA: VOC family protein [Novosphingobium sp.]|nr:VOC family protein [Novosphingobium sp.]